MDALDKLYFELVENLRREHRTALWEPVTIADLQGHLIPYQKVRDAVDFRSNDEYAATLSRLLAGEREYLIVDPVVRDELQRTLGDPLPDIRRYRAFPDVKVLLNPDTIPPPGDSRYAPPEVQDLARAALTDEAGEDIEAGADEADGAHERPGRGESAAGSATGDGLTEEGGPTLEGAAEATSEEEAGLEDAASHTCPLCGGEVPGDAVFCPFCGRRLGTGTCPECGSDLRAEWRYCPGCGTERRQGR